MNRLTVSILQDHCQGSEVAWYLADCLRCCCQDTLTSSVYRLFFLVTSPSYFFEKSSCCLFHNLSSLRSLIFWGKIKIESTVKIDVCFNILECNFAKREELEKFSITYLLAISHFLPLIFVVTRKVAEAWRKELTGEFLFLLQLDSFFSQTTSFDPHLFSLGSICRS